MKRLMGVALVTLFLAGPAHAGRDVLAEKSTRDVEAAGLRGVRVENRHGDVVVTRSPDARIHVTAIKTVRSGSREESRKLARELGVDASTENRELVVKVRYPSHRSIRIGFWDLFNDFEVPSSEVRVELSVPSGVDLAVRSSSGEIRTRGIDNPQQLDATSGDILVEDASGSLRIGTHSGDVTARNVRRAVVRTVSGSAEFEDARGPLDARSNSGDVKVVGAADSLNLGTVTGDIEVSGAEKGLRASSTSGGIEARAVRGPVELGTSSGDVQLGLRTNGEVAITTGSGDIDVTLARGGGARLELQTSNGTLRMDAPIEISSMSRRRVEGRLRSGGSSVVLRSASGDIHVRTGESES